MISEALVIPNETPTSLRIQTLPARQTLQWTGQEWSTPQESAGRHHQDGQLAPRRVLVAPAWHYRHQPKLCKRQKELQSSLSPKVAAR